MSLLQYTSNEMFSSTELIRKSKMVFNKINHKEIEKAVILRDGKPSFILMDFDTYEKIMNEYLSLQNKKTNNKETTKENNTIKIIQNQKTQKQKEVPEVKESIEENIPEKKEISKETSKQESIKERIAQRRKKRLMMKDFWE